MVHIVTAFTREPVFLDRAYESIKQITVKNHWFIVTTQDKAQNIDVTKFNNTTLLIKPEKMPMHTGVNHYYDVIPDEGQWVYILDDDNLMHKNFNYVEVPIKNEKCDMVVFGQLLEYGKIRVLSNIFDIAPQKIDNGQFILRRKAVGTLRYWPIYRGDGYFATEMRIISYEAGRNITMLPVIASYYNGQTSQKKS